MVHLATDRQVEWIEAGLKIDISLPSLCTPDPRTNDTQHVIQKYVFLCSVRRPFMRVYVFPVVPGSDVRNSVLCSVRQLEAVILPASTVRRCISFLG